MHQLILEDISSFMKELGTGYSFIESEYKTEYVGQILKYMNYVDKNIKTNMK